MNAERQGKRAANDDRDELQRAIGAALAFRRSPASPAVDEARTQIRLRRRREKVFSADADLFAEPAWNLLLDLFISESEGRLVDITGATVAMDVPASTALRWIKAILFRGLVTRLPDVNDGRRNWLRLTDKGRTLVNRTLLPDPPAS